MLASTKKKSSAQTKWQIHVQIQTAISGQVGVHGKNAVKRAVKGFKCEEDYAMESFASVVIKSGARAIRNLAKVETLFYLFINFPSYIIFL